MQPISKNFNIIPQFDMNDFIANRREFIQNLRDACHQVGFFYITNHGITPSLMKKMLTLTKVFFDLPEEEKDVISIAHSPHYRGYGKLQAEMTQGKPDFKETLDFGLEQVAKENLEFPFQILQGPNLWPDSPTLCKIHWKETVLEYISLMQKLGQRLMNAMSLTLGLSEDYFVKYFSSDKNDDYAILRMLRYPPGRSLEKQTPEIGVGAHTDFGCLVLLLQDNVGGLQVQNCQGEWVDAPPIPDSFVVNIGEMLQVWSNNFFLATPHRVINTSVNVRHSVPFFFEPNLSTVVTPLELSPELEMKKQRSSYHKPLIYGEEIFKVYKRSFKNKKQGSKTRVKKQGSSLNIGNC